MYNETILIKPLPTHVQISKHRNKVYWSIKDKRITKKLRDALSNRKIVIDPQGFFRDTVSKTRILKNTKSAGTPRLIPINNQLIYNNRLKHEQRAGYVLAIKKLLKPFLLQFPKVKEEHLPVMFEGKLWIDKKLVNWDIDNLNSIYSKVIQDELVSLGIIRGDSVDCIVKCLGLEFMGYNEIPVMELTIKSKSNNVQRM